VSIPSIWLFFRAIRLQVPCTKSNIPEDGNTH
jgi:hypothetical protein